ncbi:MAG: tRNA pseudouridine(13) synthase TruD [Thermoplasmata archaeon]
MGAAGDPGTRSMGPQPPEVERGVGIEVYLSRSPGVGGRLKSLPEDFLVEELSLPPPRVEGGEWVAARVRSRNWETNRLVRELSRAMGISRKRIQFAGTKDKRGVKVQMMSFRASEEQVRRVSLGDFEVLDTYPSDRPVELGQLLGNRFVIRLRGAQAVPGASREPPISGGEGVSGHREESPTEDQGLGESSGELRAALDAVTSELRAAGGFPNFFGIQRFGALRPVTHTIGKLMVQGNLEGAVMTYLGRPMEAEEEEARAARARLEEEWRAAACGIRGGGAEGCVESGGVKERVFGEALKYFPKRLSFERTLLQHLHNHPGDWAGALRRLPLNLLMMFVHAYQAQLFNRVLSRRILGGLPLREPVVGDIVLPADAHGRPDHDRYILVEEHNLERARRRAREGRAFVSGILFGTETPFAEGRMGEIERAVVAEEGLRPQDFIIPEIPEASSKGTRREVLVPFRPGEPEIVLEPDAVLFRFTLPRGCYATALMREYMKGEVLSY